MTVSHVVKIQHDLNIENVPLADKTSGSCGVLQDQSHRADRLLFLHPARREQNDYLWTRSAIREWKSRLRIK